MSHQGTNWAILQRGLKGSSRKTSFSALNHPVSCSVAKMVSNGLSLNKFPIFLLYLGNIQISEHPIASARSP
jgi:hypothetical protein